MHNNKYSLKIYIMNMILILYLYKKKYTLKKIIIINSLKDIFYFNFLISLILFS